MNIDTNKVRANVAAARAMVDALCKSPGEPGRREWLLSIPARPAHDPDLVIGDAVADAAKLADELDRVLGAWGEMMRSLEAAHMERDFLQRQLSDMTNKLSTVPATPAPWVRPDPPAAVRLVRAHSPGCRCTSCAVLTA